MGRGRAGSTRRAVDACQHDRDERPQEGSARRHQPSFARGGRRQGPRGPAHSEERASTGSTGRSRTLDGGRSASANIAGDDGRRPSRKTARRSRTNPERGRVATAQRGADGSGDVDRVTRACVGSVSGRRPRAGRTCPKGVGPAARAAKGRVQVLEAIAAERGSAAAPASLRDRQSGLSARASPKGRAPAAVAARPG